MKINMFIRAMSLLVSFLFTFTTVAQSTPIRSNKNSGIHYSTLAPLQDSQSLPKEPKLGRGSGLFSWLLAGVIRNSAAHKVASDEREQKRRSKMQDYVLNFDVVIETRKVDLGIPPVGSPMTLIWEAVANEIDLRTFIEYAGQLARQGYIDQEIVQKIKSIYEALPDTVEPDYVPAYQGGDEIEGTFEDVDYGRKQKLNEVIHHILNTSIDKFKIDRTSDETWELTSKQAHEALGLVVALGKLAVEPLFLRMISLRKAEDYSDTLEFIQSALTKIGKKRAPYLLQQINSRDPIVREHAVLWLGGATDIRTLIPLVKIAINDSASEGIVTIPGKQTLADIAKSSIRTMVTGDRGTQKSVIDSNERLIANYAFDIFLNPEKYPELAEVGEDGEDIRMLGAYAIGFSGSYYTYEYLRHVILENPEESEERFNALILLPHVIKNMTRDPRRNEMKDWKYTGEVRRLKSMIELQDEPYFDEASEGRILELLRENGDDFQPPTHDPANPDLEITINNLESILYKSA